MTAKQAMRKLGGEKKIKELTDRILEDFGVKVDIVPHVNEENPRDNWLNVLVETPNELFGARHRSAEREDAIEAVRGFLLEHSADMYYECGGDGKTGPIDSFRVL